MGGFFKGLFDIGKSLIPGAEKEAEPLAKELMTTAKEKAPKVMGKVQEFLNGFKEQGELHNIERATRYYPHANSAVKRVGGMSLKDIQPAREMIEGPAGEKKVKIGIDKDRAIKMSITGLYKDRSPKKMLTEMLQNAYDELRISDSKIKDIHYRSGRAEVPGKPGTKTSYMQMKDTGRGMTAEQLGTVFTNLYESGKGTESEAAGGWGVAKTSFQLGGQYFKAETIVKEADGYYKHIMEGTPEQLLEGVHIKSEKLKKPEQTGTVLTVFLKDGQGTWDADSYYRTAAQHGDPSINFHKDSYAALDSPWHVGVKIDKPANTRVLKTINTEGAEFDIVAGPKRKEPAASIDVRILNKGLLQFDHNIWLGEDVRNLPEFLTADIKATVNPGHEKYPWTQSREDLQVDVKNQIDKFVKEELFTILRKENIRELTEMWHSIAEVKYPGQFKGIHVFDDTGKLGDTIREMEKSPYWHSYFDAVLSIGDELNARYVMPESGNRVAKIGLFFPSDYSKDYARVTFGINIPNPQNLLGTVSEEAIFLNPFGVAVRNSVFQDREPLITADEMAVHQMNTMIHEFAHNMERSHGVAFEGRMAEIEASFSRTKKNELIDLLRDAIAGVENAEPNAKPSEDFNRALQRYENARIESANQERPLSKTGID